VSRRPRRKRVRAFRPSLLAVGPLMLMIGAVVSVGVHAALGVAVRDLPIGRIAADAFERDRAPVRVKRAAFDKLRDAAGEAEQAANDAAAAAPASTDTLTDRLLDAVNAAPAATETPFETDLELRSVPEPLPRFDEPPVAAADLALDSLLADFIDEPPAMDVVSPPTGDPAGAATAREADGRASDLLAALTTADAAGDAGGPLTRGGPAGALAAASGVVGGPGSTGGGSGGTGTGRGGSGGGTGDLPGMDFLSFGGAAPAVADFEPPQRLDDDFAYAVARVDERGGGAGIEPGGHFRVRISGRRSLRKLATMPKDVVFMVDTSRSIDQDTIDAITDGIANGLGAMNPDDRFNIVLFSDQVRFFQRDPTPVTPDSLRLARKWLGGVRSRGYTDVNQALRQLLRRDLSEGRVYELIMISDGKPTLGVLDTRELINLITRENDLNASIYCVGVGRGQDNRLLDFLAYRNKGFSIGVPNRRNIASEITALMSRLRFPIITDVEVRFAGSGMSEVYPLRLPNVHQGEQFEVYGRYAQPGPFTMQITGRSAGRPVDLTFSSDLNDAAGGNAEVARGWAFWKLHHLYSEIIRVGPKTELVRMVQGLRDAYGLETLY